MHLSHPFPRQRAGNPIIRKLYGIFFAACILATPLFLAGWFTLCPQYGDPTCPNVASHPQAVFAAYRAANPLLMQVFFYTNLIIPYLYPLGYIGLGLLAMERAPWTATIGIVCGWLGSIAWGFIADGTFMLSTAVQSGQDASFAVLAKAYFANPMIFSVATGWVLGHLLGYVFLGIALLRSKVIPGWAAWLIIFSAPLMGPIAYGMNIGLFQVLGYILVFIGSIPAALAMLRMKDHQVC